MKENFNILRQKFNDIKKMGAIEALRKGSTGIGYTFETLIGKEEDSESLPDYMGIEIKTKLGYSKSPITLFNCVPEKKNCSAIDYILDNYYWYSKKNNKKVFSVELYANKISRKYNYDFKLKINYLDQKISLVVFKDNILIEEICYWNFQKLERKLKRKITYLAIIIGYPYRIKEKTYYKYFKMTTYKLKDFLDFLQLIENGKIKICFYIKKDCKNTIDNHGISFKINSLYIEELFKKLHY